MNLPPVDRLLSLWLYDSLLRAFRADDDGIPILMYHGICGGGPADRRSWRSTETAISAFRAQMEFLRANDFQVVRLSDLDEALAGSGNGGRRVVLTFDDAYRNFYIYAFPVLQEFSFPATVFVATGYIAINRRSFQGEPCVTWDEIKEMRTAGIEFGSHTVSHPQLWHLNRDTIAAELRDSRAHLEDILGTQIRSFAYPFAFPEHDIHFRHLLDDLLRKCGYNIGVTTIVGTARRDQDRLSLPRLGISSRDDRAIFRAKLRGSYDWLHGPQYLWKLGKGIASGQGFAGTAQ